MMLLKIIRSNRLTCDGLRSCATTHRKQSSEFRSEVRLPFDSCPLDQSRDRRDGPVGDVKLSYSITSPDRRLGHGGLFVTSPRSASGALQSRFQGAV